MLPDLPLAVGIGTTTGPEHDFTVPPGAKWLVYGAYVGCSAAAGNMYAEIRIVVGGKVFRTANYVNFAVTQVGPAATYHNLFPRLFNSGDIIRCRSGIAGPDTTTGYLLYKELR